MTRYSIGEVAKLLGLTTQALRFYEQEGVITPYKSATGIRYYTVEQIVMLLSFKKYRQAEFSVQQIAVHFQNDDLASFYSQLGKKVDELLVRGEEMLRRAQAVHRLASLVDRARRPDGQLREVMRPALYLLNPPLHELKRATPRQSDALSACINAMPDVAIALSRRSVLNDAPRFFLAATADAAERWRLPLDDARLIPGARCVETIMRFPGAPLEEDPLTGVFERMRSMGYTPEPDGEVLSMHVASETLEGAVYLYALVYVPIV